MSPLRQALPEGDAAVAHGAAEGPGALLAAALGDLMAAGRLPRAAYAPPRLVRATAKLRARVKALAPDVAFTSPAALPIAAAACKAAAPGADVLLAEDVAARLAEAVNARIDAAGGAGAWHEWRVEAAGAHLNFHAAPGTEPGRSPLGAAPGGAGTDSAAGSRQAARAAAGPGHGLCEAVEARLCGHAAAVLEAAARDMPACAHVGAAASCSLQVPPAAEATAGQSWAPSEGPSHWPAHASLLERPCERSSGDAHPAAPVEEHAVCGPARGREAGTDLAAADCAAAHRFEVVMLPSSPEVGGPVMSSVGGLIGCHDVLRLCACGFVSHVRAWSCLYGLRNKLQGPGACWPNHAGFKVCRGPPLHADASGSYLGVPSRLAPAVVFAVLSWMVDVTPVGELVWYPRS